MTTDARGEQISSLPFPLQEGEDVLVLIRRHWWFLWPRTVLWILFALVPVIAGTLILDWLDVRDDLGIIWWGIVALWVAYWLMRILFGWYQYHNDIWVVTNQRIIDSYKRHPLSKRVSTADLVNLQDISVVKNGLTPTMLNYGSVVCETAGSGDSDFIISGIPRPEQVQLLIDRERDRERKGTPDVPGTV